MLEYHRVGSGCGLELDVRPGVFAEQMDVLASRGNVLSLDGGLDRLASAGEDPAIVITFDDGTADFMEHALPVLVDNDLPATYYIATDFIEQQRPFPDDGVPLSWSALADAVHTGLVTIGSHTHSHAVMDKLDPAIAREELASAAGLIEDRLGVPAAHFAYPKGVFGGPDVEEVVAEYHRSAALANGAVNRFGNVEPLRLDRVPIQASDTMANFVSKIDGGMRLEGVLRNALNRRRYRAALN